MGEPATDEQIGRWSKDALDLNGERRRAFLALIARIEQEVQDHRWDLSVSEKFIEQQQARIEQQQATIEQEQAEAQKWCDIAGRADNECKEQQATIERLRAVLATAVADFNDAGYVALAEYCKAALEGDDD